MLDFLPSSENLEMLRLIEFLVRARAAPVDPLHFKRLIGRGSGLEYLADIVRNALFVSKGHRQDVNISLVLERSKDFSRVVRFSGASLGSFKDLHETAILNRIIDALSFAVKLKKNEELEESGGIFVSAQSFETYFSSKIKTYTPYLLDKKGQDIRLVDIEPKPLFVLSDHTPMPRNSKKSLIRSGISTVSIGPTLLHSSQCIAVVLNEFDRKSSLKE